MNRPVHFEIHASDPARASKFYTNVFGWDFKKWETDLFEYWMVMTGKDEPGTQWPGINGGLVVRRGDAPSDTAPVNGFVCTISVAKIDETIAKIDAAGGKVALPKDMVPGVGLLAYYKDTEGNIFGILEAVMPTEAPKM
jgi:predicted enzyme related to lactoylglutathione lyase